ncbi:MAG: hypothetical protein J6J44_09740 [Lachnospiraceae bacterium]|nr:hypothetical protein [Lachnospiraceae bacterium]
MKILTNTLFITFTLFSLFTTQIQNNNPLNLCFVCSVDKNSDYESSTYDGTIKPHSLERKVKII